MRKEAAVSRAQLIIERVLSYMLAAAGCLHITVFMGKYVLGLSSSPVYDIDLYMLLTALFCAAVYLGLSLTLFRGTVRRLLRFIKRLLSPEQLLLAALLVWYIICCIKVGANQHDDYLTGNKYPLADAVMSTLVLFPLPVIFRKNRKAIRIMLSVPVAVSTAFMCYTLVRMLGIDFFSVPGGNVYITDKYSLVIACNRNITGAYGALMCMLPVYLAQGRKTWEKALYIFAAVIHLFALYIANSKTPLYAVIIAASLGAGALTFRKRGIKLAIAAGVLTGAAIFVLRIGFCEVFARVSGLAEYYGWDSISGNLRSSLDGLSGREIAWASYWDAMTHSKIVTWFGVTPVAFSSYFTMICGQFFGQMHNQYMQMSVCFGFPGLAIYTAWSVCMAVRCLKRLDSAKNILLCSVILMLVTLNMFESYLYCMTDVMGSVFFLLCGIAVAGQNE